MQGSCECDALPSWLSSIYVGLVLHASGESGTHAGVQRKCPFDAGETQLLSLIRSSVYPRSLRQPETEALAMLRRDVV